MFFSEEGNLDADMETQGEVLVMAEAETGITQL